MAAESFSIGEIFNIGGGSRISVNGLIEIIEEKIGKEAKVKYIEKQKGDVRDTLADVNKAKAELSWTPEMEIKEGLKNFVEWWKAEE